MFKNLLAEEGRHEMTNKTMAEYLGITPESYAIKKRTGRFKLREITMMLKLFKVPFEYLFAEEGDDADQFGTT